MAEAVDLGEPFENAAVQLLKQVARKTGDIAGDGTTTATVLAEAIFDEGLKSWGQTALDNGFSYLPVAGKILKTLVQLGYRPATLSSEDFDGLVEPVPTLDFSGWPMIVHKSMANDVAYALCEAIEQRKAIFPTDNYKPLDIAQLCANDDEAPFDVPLHPGAQRFYRERGFLK